MRNRYKYKLSSRSRYQGFCSYCDRCYVENNKKCDLCGRRNKESKSRVKPPKSCLLGNW
jgi:rRNA maturation endonuclease Nob1